MMRTALLISSEFSFGILVRLVCRKMSTGGPWRRYLGLNQSHEWCAALLFTVSTINVFPVYHPLPCTAPDLWNANEARGCLFVLLHRRLNKQWRVIVVQRQSPLHLYPLPFLVCIACTFIRMETKSNQHQNKCQRARADAKCQREIGPAPLISSLGEIINERLTSSSGHFKVCISWVRLSRVLLLWSFKQMWFCPQAGLRLISWNVKNQRLAGGLTYLPLITTLSAGSKFQPRNVLRPPKLPKKIGRQFSACLRFAFYLVASEQPCTYKHFQ